MLRILARALILVLVFALTAALIYQIGQRQASAFPFPEGRFRPEGERPFFAPDGPPPFERGNFEGRGFRGERFLPFAGLIGVAGRLITVIIISAIVVIVGKVARLSLISAPLPTNDASRTHM